MFTTKMFRVTTNN